MLKLTVVMLAIALAGTASAANWRDLRIDASTETAFAQSLALFKEKLSPARRLAFADALKDIWLLGTSEAAAIQREYTASDYYRQVDGLGYKEIVDFTTGGDPIVNDPAAPSNDAVRRSYDRAQFERAWLDGSGGTVYVITPPGKVLPPSPGNW